MEKVTALLISADVKAKGAALGLVDADTAMLLLDRAKIKVDENGAVTGTEEALKVLQTTKPFLFTAKPTGQKINVGKKIDPSGQDDIDGVEAAFLRKNPGLKI